MEKLIYRIEHYDNVDSTNTLLKSRAKHGENEGLVIWADSQSEGRGRLGRSFYSPDSGLYFSLLLKPDISPSKTLYITAAAAVAVCRAIQKTAGISADIKWVNDIFSDGKKVCGILAEGASKNESELSFVVLGIGVNIYSSEFPDELRDIAGCILKEKPSEDFRKKLLYAILEEFADIYSTLETADFADEYRKHSFIIGKKVYAVKGDNRCAVEVVGIDDEFRLIVKDENGEKFALTSGEVSIRF